MRETTSSYSKITYFGALWYACNPCPIRVDGWYGGILSSVDVTIASQYTATAVARSNDVVVDVSPYVRQLFSAADILGDVDALTSQLTPTATKATNTAKTITITLAVHGTHDGTEFDDEYTITGDFFWGALGMDETAGHVYDLMHYKNTRHWGTAYPFAAPMYIGVPPLPPRTIQYSLNGGGWWGDVSFSETITKGAYNLNGLPNSDVWVRFGDDVFKIRYEAVTDAAKRVYLRWIDNAGVVRFWLFKEGTRSRKTAATAFQNNGRYRSDLTTNESSNYLTGANALYRNADTMRVVYPLANADDWEVLMTLVDAPVVQMWAGGDTWVDVHTEGATYNTPTQHLHDFEANIVMPEKPTQSL